MGELFMFIEVWDIDFLGGLGYEWGSGGGGEGREW